MSVALDGSGNVQASTLYGPYGAVRYSSGTMPGTYSYTGQRTDATTGLDYYNARYYDASAGQFSSADTMADGLNRYGYVHGNPTTASDPSGHMSKTRCFAGDGCFLGGNGSAGPPPPPTTKPQPTSPRGGSQVVASPVTQSTGCGDLCMDTIRTNLEDLKKNLDPLANYHWAVYGATGAGLIANALAFAAKMSSVWLIGGYFLGFLGMVAAVVSIHELILGDMMSEIGDVLQEISDDKSDHKTFNTKLYDNLIANLHQEILRYEVADLVVGIGTLIGAFALMVSQGLAATGASWLLMGLGLGAAIGGFMLMHADETVDTYANKIRTSLSLCL